jgi:hypothetical protein
VRNGGEFQLGIYFSTDKLWIGSTRGEPGPVRTVHRGPTVAQTEGAGARQRAHRSTASGRSGAPKLTGGGAKEREEHGEFGSGLTRARAAAWRPGNGGGARGHENSVGRGSDAGEEKRRAQ